MRWDFSYELLDVAVRLAIAIGLGALIGLERQWRQRRAGMRTNALVSLGAASFMTFSTLFQDETSPTRVAAQVVSGIGFLGAGVIMRHGFNVRGLNTAATLWCAAAAGLLAGAGYPLIGVIVALLVVGTNVLLRPVAAAVSDHASARNDGEDDEDTVYELLVECDEEVAVHLRALILQGVAGGLIALRRLEAHDVDDAPCRVKLRAVFVSPGPIDDALAQVVRRFALEPGIRTVDWRVVSPD